MNTVSAITFVCAAVFIGYILVGYPALIGLLARWKRRPIRTAAVEKSVSIILPVYNGGPFLDAKIHSIFALDYPQELLEVIVVSDGSTDDTETVAQSYADRGVRFLGLPRGGKATALTRGIAEAKNEILVLTDVRQRLESESLRRLIEYFADPSIGVVSGNLLICDGDTVAEADIGLYRKYEAWIRTQLSAFSSVLGASGCYYAMRRSLARPIPEETLLDDVYLPLCAIFAGYRCVLQPRAYCVDFPTGLGSEFRRKTRTQAGVYQLISMFPALLAPWTATGFHFLSLKASRLLLPFAFLALFLASFGLPEPWRTIAVLGNLAFYLTAAADMLIPDSSKIKRLTSPFRSSLVLIASAAWAMSIFFTPPQQLWKETKVNKARSRTI
jgi:poly-beta-1,6-N-acetyl-D-glucosamine synthase